MDSKWETLGGGGFLRGHPDVVRRVLRPSPAGVTVQRPKVKGAGSRVPRVSVGGMCVVFSSTDKCFITALRAPRS